MNPSIQIFNKHVSEAHFQMGVDSGKWGIMDDISERPTWPFVYFWVQAASRPNSPEKFCFRFNLEGYNGAGPNACLWDYENGQLLPSDKWPKGTGPFATVFRPTWSNGTALYSPCDRVSLSGHPDWPVKYPSRCWKSSVDRVEKYLQHIWDLLNSGGYNGV